MSESNYSSMDKVMMIRDKISKVIVHRLKEIEQQKKETTSGFYHLSYDEQRREKLHYIKIMNSYENQVQSIEKILYRFYSLVQSINHLSTVMDSITRVRTALEVITEQFTDDFDYLEDKESLMGAFSDDISNIVIDDLNRIRSNILHFITVLDQQGFSNSSVGAKSLYEYLGELDELTVGLVDFNRIDQSLMQDLEPSVSLETEERAKLLELYDTKVETGEMSRIQKVDSRVFIAKLGLKPSRVVVTGETVRKSLEKIGMAEKQLDSIDSGMMVIRDNSISQFRNTYLLLQKFKSKMQLELSKARREFPKGDYELIQNVIGENSREEVMDTYAMIYAELEFVMKNYPDSLERIQLLRTKLYQLLFEKEMTKEEIAQATKMGRVIEFRHQVANNQERLKAQSELRDLIIDRLKTEFPNGIVSQAVVDSEIAYYMSTVFLSKEERALQSLKRHGYIDSSVSLDSLSENQRKALEIQMVLDEPIVSLISKITPGFPDGTVSRELVRERSTKKM